MKFLAWIPNGLTCCRLALAGPIAIYLWRERIGLAVSLLAVAAITDFLDGFLARELGWRTTLGSWLDPAADKTLIATVIFTLTLKGSIPVWFCWITVLRDVGLVVTAFGLAATGTRFIIRPFLSGKLATVAQNATLICAILSPVAPFFRQWLPRVLAVSAFLTLLSAVIYMRALPEMIRKSREPSTIG